MVILLGVSIYQILVHIFLRRFVDGAAVGRCAGHLVYWREERGEPLIQ